MLTNILTIHPPTPWGALVTVFELALAFVVILLFIAKKDKKEPSQREKDKADYFANKYGKHSQSK